MDVIDIHTVCSICRTTVINPDDMICATCDQFDGKTYKRKLKELTVKLGDTPITPVFIFISVKIMEKI